MRVANRGHDLRCLRRGELSHTFPLLFLLDSTAPLSKSIEGMLRSQPGIHSVKVALLAERGVVEFDPQQWNSDKVINVRIVPRTPFTFST
jgi:hypothetical protein